MSDERTATAFDKRMGARIRARRLELGISQESLAATLGITFQQVQKYERGINRTASSRLYAIAQALTVPVAYFYPSDSSQATNDLRFSERLLMTERGVGLAKLYIEAPPAIQGAIYETAKAIAAAASTKAPRRKS